MGLIRGTQGQYHFNIWKSITVIITSTAEEENLYDQINRQKKWHKIQQPFMIQTLSKLGTEEDFSSKEHLQKTCSSHQFNGEKLNTSSEIRKRKRCPIINALQHGPEVPGNMVRGGGRRYTDWEEGNKLCSLMSLSPVEKSERTN